MRARERGQERERERERERAERGRGAGARSRGDESSTLMHRRKEESSGVGCVCLRAEPERSAADRRHGGNILECHALEKSAADPNEASWEYGVLLRAKTGAGGTGDSEERPTSLDRGMISR